MSNSPKWNEAITKVLDNLSLFPSLHGGRVNAIPSIFNNRRSRIPKEDRVAV